MAVQSQSEQDSARLPPEPHLPGTPQLMQHILGAFQNHIAPVRRPLSYRAGVALAALVMVLLPLIYIGLIGLVAYAVYLHAVHDVSILESNVRGKGYLMVLVVYLAPMVIGGISILFMIKPLFARPAAESRTRSLARSSEPLLFAFVYRICEAVRAPRPKRIDVDGDVNASARFRRGMLSFLGNDLVLTIGMPLVVGLDTRQFAGVLAHEFGHFSQGAGMRLTYVVRSISMWFARVVYERDEWDKWLHETARSVDLRLGWVLFLAQGLVWLTRKVLFGLMFVGQLVSGVLLRDMEFDADRHEARLAGSETFASTARRMRELAFAMQHARGSAASFYREGRLVDNLPKLMQVNLAQIPGETLDQLHASVAEARTGWFDTHPCDRDRVLNAQRENTPGIFQLELPACCLFHDPDDLSRKVTEDLYCAVLGKQIDPAELHPVEQLLSVKNRDKEAFAALNRIYCGSYTLIRPVKLDVAPRRGEPAELEEAARAAEVRSGELAEQYGQLKEEYAQAYQRSLEAEHVLALVEAGIAVHKDNSPEGLADAKTAAQVKQNSLERLVGLGHSMGAFESSVAARIDAGLALLFAGPRQSADDDTEQGRATCRRLFPAWHALQRTFQQRLELHTNYVRLSALCAQLASHHENQAFVDALLKQMDVTAESIQVLRAGVGEACYPFDHANADMSLAHFLCDNPDLDRTNVREVYRAADSMLDTIHELTTRTLAHLALLADQATVRAMEARRTGAGCDATDVRSEV